MVDDGFKLQSTFSIKVERNSSLDKFLLNQPSKIILRRKSEASSRNRNDFVQPKAILKNIKDKPMCVSGRRRSVGYINTASNQSNEDNLVAIDSTSSNFSAQVTLTSQRNITNDKILDAAPRNSMPEETSADIEVDLITFSPEHPEFEHSQKPDTIITANESPGKQNDMNFAGIGDDLFGFLSNDETESNVNEAHHRNEFDFLQQPSTSARCLLFEDLEQSVQYPVSPQILELNRSTHKTYYGPTSQDKLRAVRNYVDLMRHEELFLHGDVAPVNTTRRPIPDLIPVQRNANELSIEEGIDTETDFGQLYFSDSN